MSSLFPPLSSASSSLYPGPVLGSDFPVEPPNPFHGMYAAVTRLNPATGTSPSGEGGWYPEEKLSIEQALQGFTRNAAYGWCKEEKAGTIEVGKWADWVVLDIDLLGAEMRESEGKMFRDVKVRETWVGGRNVWPRSLEEKSDQWRFVVENMRAWTGL
jgi:predicted amidohydrolase YtcJ